MTAVGTFLPFARRVSGPPNESCPAQRVTFPLGGACRRTVAGGLGVHRRDNDIRKVSGRKSTNCGSGAWLQSWPVGALQQLRTDQRRGFRCPRPGQHQRLLPLLAGVPLPLSQDGAGHAEAAMEFAIESDTVKGTAIDFLRLCLADRTTDHFLNAHLLGAQNIGSCSPT
jgi:hypothetical protein